MRLAHGWELAGRAPDGLVRDFIRPVVRAVPPAMALRLPPCRITATPDLEAASTWTDSPARIDITVATAGVPDHDVVLELLLCIGQAVWERLSGGELEEWWRLIAAEIRAGVEGEIDEQALEEKLRLLAGPDAARNRRILGRYGRAAFAGTAAEYVHSLWHDVTVRTGPDHLPAVALRARLELLAGWFPPGRGYRLFPR
ncbi:MAG TPA: hypothetical protein VN442_01160 [Bryobacteraceae bacterium]|nr:hypothetical protein [Bryobacteraceae bacterium]